MTDTASLRLDGLGVARFDRYEDIPGHRAWQGARLMRWTHNREAPWELDEDLARALNTVEEIGELLEQVGKKKITPYTFVKEVRRAVTA